MIPPLILLAARVRTPLRTRFFFFFFTVVGALELVLLPLLELSRDLAVSKAVEVLRLELRFFPVRVRDLDGRDVDDDSEEDGLKGRVGGGTGGPS